MHIAITSIWILPVIAAGAADPRCLPDRVGGPSSLAVVAVLLRLGLEAAGHRRRTAWLLDLDDPDAGRVRSPTMPWPAATTRPVDLPKLTGWSGVLMVLGYGFSCMGGRLAPPPFVPPAGQAVDLWTMSQRTGSVTYLTFAAGFSLAVYALFVAVCDGAGWHSALFRIFGQNALAAYVIHPIVAGAVKPYVPRDAPAWYVAAGFGLYFAICAVQPPPRETPAFSETLIAYAFRGPSETVVPQRCCLTRGRGFVLRAPGQSLRLSIFSGLGSLADLRAAAIIRRRGMPWPRNVCQMRSLK